MPTPVKSSCRKKSMLAFRFSRRLPSLRAQRSNPGAASRSPGLLRRYAPRNDGGRRKARTPRSIRKLDVLVEYDGSLFVAHDVVAVQAVAELVEVVFALGALVALGREDGFADLAGVGRGGLVYRAAQHADRVIG